MSSLLAAVDQIQGPSGTTWWVYVLAGIGVGGIISSFVTLLGQRLQRRHELNLEEIRDLQRLRDARLERLREDLRELMDSAFNFMEAMALLRYVGDDPNLESVGLLERAFTRYSSSTQRLNVTRSRLVLDADAMRIIEALPDLTNVLETVARAASDSKDVSPGQRVAYMGRIARELDGVVGKVPTMFELAQQLLQQVEQQPLYRRPGWWSRWRRKGTVQRLSQ